MMKGKLHRTVSGIEKIDFLNMNNITLRVEKKTGLAAINKRFSINISGSLQAMESVAIQHVDEVFCVTRTDDTDYLSVMIEISRLTSLWISGTSIIAKMQATLSPLRVASLGKGATLSGLVFEEKVEDGEQIVTTAAIWKPLHLLIDATGYITIQRAL